jgi:hypothetical protein
MLYGRGGGGRGSFGGSFGEGGGERFRNNPYVADLDLEEVRDMDFRSDPIPDGLECIVKSIRACGRQFSGVGFRNCILGVMVTNDMLPGAVLAGLNDVHTDASGGFATGSGFNCTSFASDSYPRMIN